MNWDTTSRRYLDPKLINRIDTLCDEKIEDRFLFEFIQTQLQISSSYEKNLHIFYTYNSYKKLYEIYFYQSKQEQFTPIDYLYSYIKNHKIDLEKYMLMISQDFFVVLIDGEFGLLRENKNYSKEDIVKYINGLYGIEFEHIYYIEDENIELQTYTKYLKKQNKNIIFYILYLTSLLLGSFYYNSYNEDRKTTTSKSYTIEYSSKIQQNINHFSKINQIFQYIKKEKLTILEYRYKKRLYLSLQGKNTNIDSFIKYLDFKTNIVSIDKKNKIVVLEIVI